MNKTEARRRKKSKKRKQQVQKRQQEKCKNKPDMVSQTIKSNTTLLQQAIAHHQAGRLQQAELIYQQIIEVEPENANAYHLLGVIAHQVGRNDIAIQLISKSIEKDSNQPFFYNSLGNVLKEQGKLDDAIQSYQKILSINPDLAEAHYNLGVVLQEQGKLDDAIQSYQQVLSINPDLAGAHYNLGNVLKEQGKLDDAIQSYQRALSINPDYAEAHSNLGVALQEQGKLDDAIQSYQRALSINPDYAEAHNNLGSVLGKQGKLDDAIQSYQRALNINPDLAEAHSNLGVSLQDQGKLDDAIQSYRRVLSINPDYAEAHRNLGVALQEQGKLDDAIQSYQRALSINPDYAEAHSNLGSVLGKQGKLDDAIQSYQRALNINPDLAEAHKNLGVALHEQGKLDDAIQSYRRALSINPDYALAHHNLAKLKRHTKYDYEIQKMEVLHRKLDITAEQRMNLAFGLGKAFEDLGEYEKSFSFILEGNKLKRNTYTYNILEARDFFNSLINVFNDQLFRKHNGTGHDDCTPIFIVGMPRSGSSLVEQILASHPLVYGAGELKDLSQIPLHSSEKMTGYKFPYCVEKLSPEMLEKAGADYTKSLRRFSGSAKYITDKMLNNFLFIGMIRLILPNAKIIHCKRDPKDICLSVFKNYFATDYHKYAYDLRELGEYYNLYQGLMDYWYNILPGYIFGIQYEDIVGNQEDTTRKLLEYCELPWDEACLSFHRTVRPVRTASVEQVRRPIYNSSVGLWRQYEKHLSPLLNALGCAGL